MPISFCWSEGSTCFPCLSNFATRKKVLSRTGLRLLLCCKAGLPRGLYVCMYASCCVKLSFLKALVLTCTTNRFFPRPPIHAFGTEKIWRGKFARKQICGIMQLAISLPFPLAQECPFEGICWFFFFQAPGGKRRVG